MENILSSPLMLVVLGAVTTGITQIIKTTKIPTIYIVAGLSFLFGGSYFAYHQFVDPATQQEVLTSSSQILGYSVLVYEFLIKKFNKNLK